MRRRRKTIGLITYHAAYNFGSMLQALATQITLKKLYGNCEIINYVTMAQKKIYALTASNKETKPEQFNKEKSDLGILYDYRVLREKRFLKFKNHFKMTKEYNSFEPALEKMKSYDVLVSGSDQILNRNTGELSQYSIDYMRPYLVDVPGKNRVSYASSFGNMTDEQLKELEPFLRNFSHFSVRESSWVERVQKFCNAPVYNVCDPTFLLTKEEWIKVLGLKKRECEKFILLYSLYRYDQIVEKLKILLPKLKYHDLKIHIVAPFCDKSLEHIDPRIVDCLSFGPKEFLEDLYNATFVIPESFHGTAFCAIFNKRFVCPCGNAGPELRKHDVLNSIGLGSQLRPNFWEIQLKDIFEDIDYFEANKLIEKNRQYSIQYLKNSIGL